MKNLFLQAVAKYNTYTENGAISHSTTGDALVDYFAKAGTYRDREIKDVYADVSRIWAESPLLSLQILFYLRNITRNTKGFFQSEKVQKGQGVRDEFRKAISWVAKYKADTFYKNIWLVPVVGTWKDLWHIDLIDHLDHPKVYALIQKGLNDPYNRELIAKYLPKIRSKANTHNERHEKLNAFAYGLCKYLAWTGRDYRKFKSSGQAHQFQQLMGAGLWDELEFSKIPGKALHQIVNVRGKDGKTVLERHNLETRYLAWLKTQPVAKFTGYVYELVNVVKQGRLSMAQKFTMDKQFDGLVELAKKDDGGIQENVWCALDTSGSMGSQVVSGISAYDICIGLGVYFSALNEGNFKDNVVMFDNTSRVLQLKGNFTDKINQIRSTSTAWGSTNFQSVINEIVRVRRSNPNIPVEDFPTCLLVVSDMQFNPVGGNAKTNYEEAMAKLAAVGLLKMKIVWWWVTGRGKDFPSQMDDEGVTMIGGFDGSVVSLILGGESTTVDTETGKVRQLNAYENMLKALEQEILLQVKL